MHHDDALSAGAVENHILGEPDDRNASYIVKPDEWGPPQRTHAGHLYELLEGVGQRPQESRCRRGVVMVNVRGVFVDFVLGGGTYENAIVHARGFW